MKIRVLCALLAALIASEMAAPTPPDPSANDRLAGLAMLVFNGKTEEARPRILKSIEQFHAESNPAGEGISLVLLGIADAGAANTAAARNDLERGSEKLKESGDSFSSLLALWMIAHIDTDEGNTPIAIASHEKALRALEEAAAPGAHFTLDGFRYLAPAVGIDARMLETVLANPEILKPILLGAIEAMIRDSYGHLLTAAGRLDDAERQLKRAAEAGGLLASMFESSIEAHLGDVERRRWHFDRARIHYRNALDSVTPMPMIQGRDEWLNVSILGQLAEIELLSGQTDKALVWSDKALAIARTSGNRRREASLLEDRASLLMRDSRFDDAEKVFSDSLRMAESLGDVDRIASVSSQLGSLYMFRGQYGKSAAAFERAVDLFKKTKQAESEAATWISLAEVYICLNRDDTAQDVLRRARERAKNASYRPAIELIDVVASADKWMTGKGSAKEVAGYFGHWWELPETRDLILTEDVRLLIRNVIGLDDSPAAGAAPRVGPSMPMMSGMMHLIRGKKMFEQGDIAGARALWIKAADENPSTDLQSGYLAAIGATYWKEGKEDEAVRYFERALQALGKTVDDIKVEDALAGYLGSNRRWYFNIAIEMLVRKGRVDEAFDQAERARARAFLHSMGNARLQPAHGAAAELVNEADALRRSIAEWERDSAFKPVADVEDLRNARERYAALLPRVKASNPEYASLTTVEPLRVPDVQRELPLYTTLVSFFVTGSRIHVWLIDRASLQYVALPIDAGRLERAVCWASSLAGDVQATRSMAPERSACSDSLTADDVYDLLFAPLRGKIHNSRLILVPHGVLHYVPFAALRDRTTGHYLVEDYVLTYSPSASVLRFIREKETPVNDRALVIGDPATPMTSAGRLSGAQREAVAIAQAFATEPKVGAAATEDLLYNLGGKFDLIHIGAHATYDVEHPLFSSIFLAKDKRGNGMLDVNDLLSDVDLSGVNLVVLSACRTASGARSNGDEIVGLTRAVLYAGAPGVISTLWNIDDEAAADLMIDFYGRLRAGTLAADALHGAQLAMLKRAPYRDPRYWAAFELSGNPQGQFGRPPAKAQQ